MSESPRAESPLAMSSPDIADEDVRAVVEVLRSGRLALGPRSEAFERRFADLLGVRHAVAVQSGTAALHLIVRALGIGPGDEVVLPSFTFVATANAVLYEGATPVFAEIEPVHLCIDPADVARRITPHTRAVLAVDLFGHPANWSALGELADAHGLALIDDACEALGSRLDGVPIGRQGDAAAFAFYPNKQITTGEGGMLVTSRDDLAEAARSLRNHGRERTGAELRHDRLGFNYRMDEMSAALGLSQLERLSELTSRRERVAGWYLDELRTVDGVIPPAIARGVRLSWFAFVIRLEQGLDRASLLAELESAGVPARAYFPPIHRQPYVVERLGPPAALPVTEHVAASTVALPFHGAMRRSDVERAAGALRAAVAHQRETRA
jgi:perosamine synthetase